MKMPTPTLPRHLRNEIAQLQCDNRLCNYKVSELLLLVESMFHSISDTIAIIERHEHNDTVLMVLEADLAALLEVANDKLLNLESVK